MQLLFKRGLSHILKTWQHHLPLQMATVVVLTASFSVVIGTIILGQNMKNILTLWGESMQVSVYLNEKATKENVMEVWNYLENQPDIDFFKFVPKESALSLFKEQMASYAPGLLADDDLIQFVPSSFQFGLKKDLAPQFRTSLIQKIATQLGTMNAVDDVSYGQNWIKNYSLLINAMNFAGVFIIFVIAVSALFVMSNSIQNSISQRSNEIEVLELVGASTNYIRGPFVWEGAFLGGLSSLLALGITFGLYNLARHYIHEQLAFLQLLDYIEFIYTDTTIVIIALGSLAGAISAWSCVRRINSGWASANAYQ